MPLVAENASTPPIQEARKFFQNFNTLSNQFDAALVDLYADEAIIKAFRRYPTGAIRQMQMEGRQYKSLLRRVMPLARLQNDRSIYSDVDFSAEGDAVRIKPTRYSVRKDYTSPHFMLIRPDATGQWRIFEETIHTQP